MWRAGKSSVICIYINQKKSLCNLLRRLQLPRPRRRLGQRDTVLQVPFTTCPTHGPGCRSALSAPDHANGSHRVDKQLGRIELARNTKLGRCIVKGVLVVPIVPSLTHCKPRDNGVLCRIGQYIVGVIPVQVCRRVDQPGKVQDDAVAKTARDQKGRPKVLSPKVGSDLGWHDVAHVEGKPGIQFFLIVDNGVFHQVGKVHFATGFNDIRVFSDKEPSHVGKEKASSGIVRVRVRFGKLVVDAVIAAPVVNGALIGNGVAEHEKETNGKGSFVGSVRP